MICALTPEPGTEEEWIAAIAAAERDYVATLDLIGQQAAACELAHRLSEAFGAGREEIFEQLCQLPDNMLSLLHSPQGWSALAAFVGGGLGVPDLCFAPTVH